MRFQFAVRPSGRLFTADDNEALYSMDVGSAIHIQR